MLRKVDEHPIQLDETSVTLQRGGDGRVVYRAKEHGLGCISLRPLSSERLEIMVWGADYGSLTIATRLLPMISGFMQPDFIVTTREMLWKGAEGALAMGFFDSHWRHRDCP